MLDFSRRSRDGNAGPVANDKKTLGLQESIRSCDCVQVDTEVDSKLTHRRENQSRAKYPRGDEAPRLVGDLLINRGLEVSVDGYSEHDKRTVCDLVYSCQDLSQMAPGCRSVRKFERVTTQRVAERVVSENSIALQRNHLPNVFLPRNPSPSLYSGNRSVDLQRHGPIVGGPI